MCILSRINARRILVCAGLMLLSYAFYYGWQLLIIGAAYKAKVLCSSVFISKRSPPDVLHEDLNGLLSHIAAEVDFERTSVSTSFPGIPSQRATFRARLGCTLHANSATVPAQTQHKEAGIETSASAAMPDTSVGLAASAESLPTATSSSTLTRVLEDAFREQDPENPIRTRAVVIVYDGRIIAERYAPGMSASTALPGWSMTKSVTNALVGILVNQGKLSIDQPVALAEWSQAGDPRKSITLDHLLRMSSGLAFDERSGPVLSDVNNMLLRSRDAAAYALGKPLHYEPGSHWQYSSGTTNIISRLIRNGVGGNEATYHAFPRKTLFDKIGMRSAILEIDAGGTFVASSFMYATARDWARFGLLYLQDGVWKGERILPSGWVSYSTRPSPTSPQGQYGAHFWTNGRDVPGGRAKPLEKLPADTFYASGYEGQYIVVVPSRRLVIVRLGLTKNRKAWDMERFVSDVLAELPTHQRTSSGDQPPPEKPLGPLPADTTS